MVMRENCTNLVTNLFSTHDLTALMSDFIPLNVMSQLTALEATNKAHFWLCVCLMEPLRFYGFVAV